MKIPAWLKSCEMPITRHVQTSCLNGRDQMKLYLNNGEMIECTVDEFEELYARGYLGENGMQKALDK